MICFSLREPRTYVAEILCCRLEDVAEPMRRGMGFKRPQTMPAKLVRIFTQVVEPWDYDHQQHSYYADLNSPDADSELSELLACFDAQLTQENFNLVFVNNLLEHQKIVVSHRHGQIRECTHVNFSKVIA